MKNLSFLKLESAGFFPRKTKRKKSCEESAVGKPKRWKKTSSNFIFLFYRKVVKRANICVLSGHILKRLKTKPKRIRIQTEAREFYAHFKKAKLIN